VPADVVEMGSTEGGLWVQTGDGTVWREAAEGMHPALLPEEWQGGPLRQWFTTGEFNVLVGDSVVLRSADGRVPCAVAHSPLWGGARAAADAEGNVWCAAIPEGVVRLGPDPFEWFALPERLRIRVMEFGSEDVVWCGSEHGVHRGHWDGRGLMWASLPLPSVTVLRAVGAESVLVGTVDGAFLVSGMPPRIVARWTVDHGLPSPVVTALTGDDHSGWIGTLSGASYPTHMACGWALGPALGTSTATRCNS
jgi:ligand-binding sensor domain-containing protein